VKSRFGKNSVLVEYDGDGGFLRSLPGVARVDDYGGYREVRLRDGADPQALLGRWWKGWRCAASSIVPADRCTTSSSSRWGRSRPMHKLRMVIPPARYLDRIRKKSFWLGTLLFPLLMLGLDLFPVPAGGRGGGEAPVDRRW